MSLQEAILRIPSSGRTFIQGAAATPNALIDELVRQSHRFKNLEIMHLHTMGPAPYIEDQFRENFRLANFFVGENIRHNLDYERIDYLPCFLSEIPALFRKNIRRPNVALVQVSQPDEHGYVSLGTSVDVAKAAVEVADIVIALVNKHMPRVFGDGIIHRSQIHFAVEVNSPLPESLCRAISPVEKKIGGHVAALIEDGSTLQMGIGAIPNAVLENLGHHKNLGIHSEMWSDGALPLLEKGVVNNSQKKIFPYKTVSSFLFGSKRLYDFVHNNPSVMQLDVGLVNNPMVIAKNPKVVAINSAVQVDVTGQVCADSVGYEVISGVGGQLDFVRGAAMSQGGKSIIALSSITKTGISRIVSALNLGAGVVTTRADVHYVVTEYGVANLYGKTIHERAKALIEIAHPSIREELARSWRDSRRK